MGLFTVGTVVLAAAVTTATPGAPAAEAPPQQLVLKPKAALAAVVSPPRPSAPFLNPAGDVDLELPLPPRADPRLAGSPSACTGERSLCYDRGSGRIVYRPARQLMPTFPGLTPENISVRRDRITFRYSF